MTAIENVKNKYSGAVLLVGNGPSLNNFTLDGCLIPSMAMNGISLLYKRTSWRPTFYIGLGTACTEPHYKSVMKPSMDKADFSFVHENAKYKNDTAIELKRDEGMNWHDDLTEAISCYGTSAFAGFQIIHWLGFNQIYMIGFDGGYKNPVDGKLTHYFDDDYPKTKTYNYNDHDWSQVNRDHQKAMSYGFQMLKERNIKVYSIERLK